MKLFLTCISYGSFSFLCTFLASVILLSGEISVSQAADTFPVYPAIQKNIEFWKKVYSAYPSTKGFVHDSWDLGVIYETVDLMDAEAPGARRTNRKRIKQAKAKIRLILQGFAKGKKPATAYEKKVRNLWSKNISRKEFKKAASNIRFQHCISDRFQEGLRQSGRYLEAMKKIIRQYGLPVDLAYLPHVESSFNYKAYSKFGAAGIWQFIRSTGRRFLTIDYTVDERRDPLRATHAAAQYLKENYTILGEWPLALTAYNHGATGLLKAKKKHGGYERIYSNYKSRRFGFASRNFYAEFLAAREIATNYNKYFKGLQLYPASAYYEIELTSYYAIEDLAKHLGVTVATIRSLNPGLRKPVFTGQKYVPRGYKLQLPKSEKIVALANTIPHKYARKNQKRSRFYRVSRGDTAGKIAWMHGVKLHDLISSNNLNRKARIFVGQNLVIPGPNTKKTAVASLTDRTDKRKPPLAVADKKQDSPALITITKRDQKTKVRSAGSNSKVDDTQGETLKVKRNDFGENIKKAKSIEVSSAGALEPMPKNLSNNPGAILGDFQVGKVVEKESYKYGIIKVEVAETLGHYADWLGVKTSQVRRLNNLSFGRAIRFGKKIKIPLTKISRELFEERRYEYHRGIEEDFFAAYKIIDTETYIVKSGDNIWTLCHNVLDLPFWLVKKYNSQISFDELKLDQVLIIPQVEDLT